MAAARIELVAPLEPRAQADLSPWLCLHAHAHLNPTGLVGFFAPTKDGIERPDLLHVTSLPSALPSAYEAHFSNRLKRAV